MDLPPPTDGPARLPADEPTVESAEPRSTNSGEVLGQAVESAIDAAVDAAVDEAVEAAVDEAVEEAVTEAMHRRRRRFGVEIVLAALLVGAAAGATTGVLASRQDRNRNGAPTTTVATTVPPTIAVTVLSTTTEPTTTAAPETTVPETLQAVIRRTVLSVVDIDVSGTLIDEYGRVRKGDWAGSGFVIDASGVIATNAHVVDGAESIVVRTHDGRWSTATLLGMDDEEDLAVLKVDLTDLVALDLGLNQLVEVGDSVIAIGNALNLEGDPTVSVGIVSALSRNIRFADGSTLSGLIQTDASISSGDSGGPLLTTAGVVIGVNTAGISDAETTSAENIGFAIPISQAAPILFRLAGLPY